MSFPSPLAPSAKRNRRRKFVGGVVMLLFVIVYALAAMALAQARVVQDAGRLTQTVVYAVLGIGWILPLLPLIRWTERRPPPNSGD